VFVHIRDAGYAVIAFEGPGQGGALEESGLARTLRTIVNWLDEKGLPRLRVAGYSRDADDLRVV